MGFYSARMRVPLQLTVCTGAAPRILAPFPLAGRGQNCLVYLVAPVQEEAGPKLAVLNGHTGSLCAVVRRANEPCAVDCVGPAAGCGGLRWLATGCPIGGAGPYSPYLSGWSFRLRPVQRHEWVRAPAGTNCHQRALGLGSWFCGGRRRRRCEGCYRHCGISWPRLPTRAHCKTLPLGCGSSEPGRRSGSSVAGPLGVPALLRRGGGGWAAL